MNSLFALSLPLLASGLAIATFVAAQTGPESATPATEQSHKPVQAETLQQALTCKLSDPQLPGLMQKLRAQYPEFAKPSLKLGMPNLDVYQLTTPVNALGYSADRVAVLGGRVLLVVQGVKAGEAAATLKLQAVEVGPRDADLAPTALWSYPVRSGVAVIAAKVPHAELAGTALVGCDYAQPSAFDWLGGRSLGGFASTQ